MSVVVTLLSMNKRKRIESKIGYTFSDEHLLDLALSHRSVGSKNNERLEFLGDSLLNFIIAQALFMRFPKASEGELSRLRSLLVKGETLASIAREFDLGDHLLLGEGELKSGGFRRSSILADAVEAIIGGIYLDASFPVCQEKVLNWYQSRLDECSLEENVKDPKTRLQEYLQERKKPLPVYSILNIDGEDHSRIFSVECRIQGQKKATLGVSTNKRSAEKEAAEKMLQQLQQ